MIKTILYSTDLGWFSPHIMQHVITLATNCNANVIVVHAIEPLGTLGHAVVKSFIEEDDGDQTERIEHIKNEVKERVIDAFAEEYMRGDEDLAVIKDIVIEQGRPAEVILREAAKWSADMIVMGRHGQHSMDPNLLGSVTSKVLQLAKIPVFMIPVMKSPLAIPMSQKQVSHFNLYN